MKPYIIFCILAMSIFIGSHAYATCGTPTVSVTHVDASTNIGGYFKTTIDFAGCGDSDAAKLETLGHNYADAIVEAYDDVYSDDLGQSISGYIREIDAFLNFYGIYFKDSDNPPDYDDNILMDRARALRHKVENDGYAHYLHHVIVGMSGVLNPDNKPDRIWYLGFEDNYLTVNELYLWNFIAETLSYSGCSTIGAWGNATSDGKVIVGRNTDYYPGTTLDGHTAMITSMHQILYLKNQLGEDETMMHDTIMFNFLGEIAGVVGVNDEGLFISANYSQNLAADYNFVEKYPIGIREALGKYQTVSDDCVSYFTSKEYPVGWLTTLADTSVVKIIENCWDGSTYEHAVRLYNSDLRLSEEEWDYMNFTGPVIVALNSNLMESMVNNHDDDTYQANVNHQVYRLANYNTEIQARDHDQDKITMDDIKAMVSWRHEPNTEGHEDGDEDIFWANSTEATIQSVVYKPATSGNTKVLRRLIQINLPTSPRAQLIIPVAVELMLMERQAAHRIFRNRDSGRVFSIVEHCFDPQTGGCTGIADKLNYSLKGPERLASPVLGNVAEQSMFDFIPLACPRWKMADTDFHVEVDG